MTERALDTAAIRDRRTRQALRRAVGAARLRPRGARGHGARPARTQRRRQDDGDQDPDHARPADRRQRARGRLRRRADARRGALGGSACRARRATVDGLMSAPREPRDDRPPLSPAARDCATARDELLERLGLADTATAPRAGLLGRYAPPPRPRGEPRRARRRCCSSTSRPPVSTLRAATSCGSCCGAGRGRHDPAADHPVPGGGRPPQPTTSCARPRPHRGDRDARRAEGSASAASGSRSRSPTPAARAAAAARSRRSPRAPAAATRAAARDRAGARGHAAGRGRARARRRRRGGDDVHRREATLDDVFLSITRAADGRRRSRHERPCPTRASASTRRPSPS